MLPRRRYRLLLFVAAVVVFLFYRAAHSADWDPSEYTRFGQRPQQYPSYFDSDRNPLHKPPTQEAPEASVEDDSHPAHPPPQDEDDSEPPAINIPVLKPGDKDDVNFALPTKAANVDPAAAVDDAKTAVTKVPWYEELAPGMHTTPSTTTTTSTTTYPHWQKFSEHFPVAAEDLILLPTGTPKAIPKIQFDFPKESPAAKEKREGRLAEIKSEMKRAWNGYRTYAWMHDEISPVTKLFRDPFCGWAATLVDALDTLWIMGMKEEFHEAAHAVDTIDFTYSTQRFDIPVFETVIRYLGGLLAAYDVSGGHEGKYPMLLKKAEELAEILYGVFDTPNRMPILYYQWRPEYVAQPHRASVVSTAEVGSLLMEFTHLAQLTGKQKYYDAVARITNAFEGLQKGGTAIQGIFPETLDANGCNRTATDLKRQAELAAQHQSTGGTDLSGSSRASPNELPVVQRGDSIVGTSFAPPSQPDEEEAAAPQSERGSQAGLKMKRGFREVHADPKVDARDDDGVAIPVGSFNPWDPMSLIDLDCVPQAPLVPLSYGYQSYSMGGSQDSTYEYFPKTYLLLGGLEPKYRNMHEKTVAAVKRWLLYRPMTKDQRDILFSAKLTTNGVPEVDARREYEVTHLTCFLGGMFGLGGKIFDSEEDLEIAKKLTDGCVWAYESMPSGIMPEGANVVPCEGFKACPWNETLWYQGLDPLWEYRDQQVADYLVNKKEAEAHQKMLESQRELQNLKEQQTPSQGGAGGQDDRPAHQPPSNAAEEQVARKKTLYEIEVENSGALAPKMRDEEDKPAKAAEPVPENDGSYRYPRPEPAAKIARRDGGEAQDSNVAEPAPASSAADTNPDSLAAALSQIPIEVEEDPQKPPTHLEFVKNRIANEKIPPGFSKIPSKHYILRPEAIESVWYMYRITGDPTWQEKGWRMWKSIIEAVRTEVGHSAIYDVLMENSPQKDSMESFWLAETLKYFYLLFSTPDVLSLDEWVLNTEAHPFRRPDAKKA